MPRRPSTRFGRRLARLMRAADIGNREMGRRVGVSHRAVARWFEGSYPSLEIAARVARVLRVTIDHLAGGP